MIEKQYADKKEVDFIRQSTNGICDIIKEKSDYLVVDHMHLGESALMGLPEENDGCIRGVINSDINITLGYLMKDAKHYNISIFEYLQLLTEYLAKLPSNKIYHTHPKDEYEYFKSLDVEDKKEFIAYNFGIDCDNMLSENLDVLCNTQLKDKYKLPKRLKL